MVHYAIVATHNPSGDFKGFLLSNPQFSDGGLFLEYYEKKTMLHNPTAKEQVVLPDKKPLPSMVSNALTKGANLESKEADSNEEKKVSAPLTDEEFLVSFDAKALKNWSHKSYIRLVWCFLHEYESKKSSGARRAKFVDQIFDKLKTQEGKAFHATIAYFWIQMVHNAMLSEGKDQSGTFEVFWENESASKLQNSLLHQEYYSRDLIASQDAQKDTVLPDLQPLPSIVLPITKK
jgi:hypothetical protein